MLPEILMQRLRVLFVGTALAEISDELGFRYLTTNNRFWPMLEYAGLTPAVLITPSERKVLDNARVSGVLTEMYKKFFYEKREATLLAQRIGLTEFNRRRVYASEDDRDADPTPEDVQKLVKTVEKYRPKIVAFVTKPETFVRAFKPLYPSVTPERGRQEFLLGTSEVWLLGSTNGRLKDDSALEDAFDALSERLAALEADAKQ
jgi:G:T/U-mismatch repair DNA glycosylase